MKEFFKLIAPYMTTIFAAIGLYADNASKQKLIEYRVEKVEQMQNTLGENVNSIKDLLYSINTKLEVYSVKSELCPAKSEGK